MYRRAAPVLPSRCVKEHQYTLLYNVYQMKEWCYGTLRQMKEGIHAYEGVAFDNFFTVNIRDMD